MKYCDEVFRPGQANEMALFKATLLGGEAIVTRFSFNEAGMNDKSLRIKVFEDYSEEWADFVFANREGKPVKQYDDIVYGHFQSAGYLFSFLKNELETGKFA